MLLLLRRLALRLARRRALRRLALRRRRRRLQLSLQPLQLSLQPLHLQPLLLHLRTREPPHLRLQPRPPPLELEFQRRHRPPSRHPLG